MNKEENPPFNECYSEGDLVILKKGKYRTNYYFPDFKVNRKEQIAFVLKVESHIHVFALGTIYAHQIKCEDNLILEPVYFNELQPWLNISDFILMTKDEQNKKYSEYMLLKKKFIE